MKRVTSTKISEIKRLASEGKSMREIGKSVHLHHSTVASYLKSVEAQKNRGGRPKALSKRLVTQVVRGIESSALVNARHAADHIFNTHSIKISKWTIARTLRSKGLKSYARPKKPRLTSKHKMERREYARVMKRFPIELWQRVVFTDECRVCAYGPDGNNRVWRRPESRLLDHHVIQTVRFGGVSVMIWGAITYWGVGKVAFIDGRMDSVQYVAILRSAYAQTLEMHGMTLEDSILQQDNDSKHLSRYTKRCLLDDGVRVLRWASYSPDMNPIENVWHYLKCKISLAGRKPQTVLELKTLIEEIWYSIPAEFVQRLFDGIPTRINDLLKAKGGYTRY